MNNIGLLLTKTINNNSKENKLLLLNDINKFIKAKEAKQMDLIKKKNFYIDNYELKRKEDENTYAEYKEEYKELYNNWKKSKKIVDLQKLLALKSPSLNNVDDIYTSDIIKNQKLK